jgi:hypothetical protein
MGRGRKKMGVGEREPHVSWAQRQKAVLRSRPMLKEEETD